MVTNAPSAMPLKTCVRCKNETSTDDSRCPKCGGVMRTRTTVRILGLVLTILGGSLLIGMGMIALWALNLIRHSNDPGTTSNFTGTERQMYMMFGAFGFVMLFGLAALAAGLWQLIFGRRNMVLVWIVLGLGGLFIVGGFAFNTFWSGH